MISCFWTFSYFQKGVENMPVRALYLINRNDKVYIVGAYSPEEAEEAVTRYDRNQVHYRQQLPNNRKCEGNFLQRTSDCFEFVVEKDGYDEAWYEYESEGEEKLQFCMPPPPGQLKPETIAALCG